MRRSRKSRPSLSTVTDWYSERFERAALPLRPVEAQLAEVGFSSEIVQTGGHLRHP